MVYRTLPNSKDQVKGMAITLSLGSQNGTKQYSENIFSWENMSRKRDLGLALYKEDLQALNSCN